MQEILNAAQEHIVCSLFVGWLADTVLGAKVQVNAGNA